MFIAWFELKVSLKPDDQDAVIDKMYLLVDASTQEQARQKVRDHWTHVTENDPFRSYQVVGQIRLGQTI